MMSLSIVIMCFFSSIIFSIVAIVRHQTLFRHAELVKLHEQVHLLHDTVDRFLILNVQRDVLHEVEVLDHLNDTLVQLEIFGREELIHISEAFLSTHRHDLVKEGLLSIEVIPSCLLELVHFSQDV